jgi:hypothetical protein
MSTTPQADYLGDAAPRTVQDSAAADRMPSAANTGAKAGDSDTSMEWKPRSWPLMDDPGQPAHAYEAEGRMSRALPGNAAEASTTGIIPVLV